ncbi:MAG: hypothetical protein KIS66_05290 [Fimbriimonadaceae bacterium]|nr:hypothetical protein [Fimbriimonadaceae bacterium]
MYEPRGKPPIPPREFFVRVLRHALVAGVIVGLALGIGVLGYHRFAGLDWLDSLLEASMILGGMGPIQAPHTAPAKLFASFYALFSGLAFVAIAGVMIAPVAHRLLHRFHWEEEAE